MTNHAIRVLLGTAEILFFIGVIVIFLRNLSKRKKASTFDDWEKYDSSVKQFVDGFVFVAGTVAFLFLAGWLNKHGSDLLKWTVMKLGSVVVRYFVVLGVLVLGMVANYFKRITQKKYGLVEVIFGMTGAVIALQHVDVSKFFPTVVTLGGCVYIVARGIGNFFEGSAAEETKSEWLKRWEAERRWLEERSWMNASK